MGWTDQYRGQKGGSVGVHWPSRPQAELKDTELQLTSSSLSNTGKGTPPADMGRAAFLPLFEMLSGVMESTFQKHFKGAFHNPTVHHSATDQQMVI